MYQVVMGVAPDGERTADKVTAVAALPQAPEAVRVTVVHVTDEPDVESVPAVGAALDALADAGVTAEAVAGEEQPTDALLRTAARVDADLVCVAGRRRSPAGKLQLKSGSQEVILNTDRPVLVAGRADGDGE